MKYQENPVGLYMKIVQSPPLQCLLYLYILFANKELPAEHQDKYLSGWIKMLRLQIPAMRWHISSVPVHHTDWNN